MAIFIILALKDNNATVDAAVERTFPEDSYKIEPGKWVVNADLPTAKGVSEKLGISGQYQHLVFPVKGYHGRAQPDLWEWLAAQRTANA